MCQCHSESPDDVSRGECLQRRGDARSTGTSLLEGPPPAGMPVEVVPENEGDVTTSHTNKDQSLSHRRACRETGRAFCSQEEPDPDGSTDGQRERRYV